MPSLHLNILLLSQLITKQMSYSFLFQFLLNNTMLLILMIRYITTIVPLTKIYGHISMASRYTSVTLLSNLADQKSGFSNRPTKALLHACLKSVSNLWNKLSCIHHQRNYCLITSLRNDFTSRLQKKCKLPSIRTDSN